MERCECDKKGLSICNFIALLLGIIAGIAVGVIVSSGVELLATRLLIIASITSIIGIGFVFFTLFVSNFIKGCNKFFSCTCKNSKVLFISSIGTFIVSVIGLIVGVTVASTLTTIILALTSALFVVMLVSLICLVFCIIKNLCEFDYE